MGTRSSLKSLPDVAKSAVKDYFDPIQGIANALGSGNKKLSNQTKNAEVAIVESGPVESNTSNRAEAASIPDIEPNGRLAKAEEEARFIVRKWAQATGTFRWVPGSAFSLPELSPTFLRAVAKAFGVENYEVDHVRAVISEKLPKALFASEVLSLLPVIGWVAKSALMATAYQFIGEKVVQYFKSRSPYS